MRTHFPVLKTIKISSCLTLPRKPKISPSQDYHLRVFRHNRMRRLAPSSKCSKIMIRRFFARYFLSKTMVILTQVLRPSWRCKWNQRKRICRKDLHLLLRKCPLPPPKIRQLQMTQLKKRPWTSKLRSSLTRCWPKILNLTYNSKTKRPKNST